MVFVTVGNTNQGFIRLLEAVDKVARQGVFGEDEVVVQSGNNRGFKSRHCKNVPFMSMEEFTRMIAVSTVVICHAGAGTLITVLETGKVPIVMARLKKYGEHVDDHQLELVEALEGEGRIIAASNEDEIERAFCLTKKQKVQEADLKVPPMLGVVKKAIEEMLQISDIP